MSAMPRLAAWLVLSCLVAPLLVAQRPEATPEVALLRCYQRSGTPCLTATVNLEPKAALEAGSTGPGSNAPAWRARFLEDTALTGLGRTGDAGRAVRLLVLVDVSGSMRGVGITSTRLVLNDFLRSLDSLPAGAIRVAVAPFESRGVRSGIRVTALTTPDSARLQVGRLPEPSTGNTGLYSAVVFGAEWLGEALAAAPAGTVGGIVTITDGDNSVNHPGDDPGLLDGDPGITLAVDAVGRVGANLWIVGIGNLDGRKLTALAGTKGRPYLVGLDVYQLAQPFAEIRRSLWTSWEVAFAATGASREELGRGWAGMTVRLERPGSPAVGAGAAAWRPPVIALPAFAGVSDPSLVPVELRQRLAGGGQALDRRIPLALFLGVLLLLLWLVIPRLVWPPLVIAAPAEAAEVKPAATAKAERAPVSAGGLRTDVKEAAPRKPGDVTASKTRRAR